MRRYGWWQSCCLAMCAMLCGCATIVQTLGKTSPTGAPPTSAQQGSVVISPRYSAIAPGSTEHFRATAAGGGALEWLVNGVAGGNASVGTVDANGVYTAPVNLPVSINVSVTAAVAASPQANFATAVVSVINPGVVTPTANPQVATYSIYLPAPGNVTIDFGLDKSYGLETWQQTTPSANGGKVSIYVAGMLGNKEYHMSAQVLLADGATFTDADQTFTTRTPPATSPVTASAVNGQVPQPGVVMFDTLVPYEQSQAFATDLHGNVIWTYTYPDGTLSDAVQPIKLLPNGHFLVLLSYASSIAVHGGQVRPGTVDAVREVDLAGNTIREVTESDLAAALKAQGYDLQLGSFHHDVLALPNGHWVFLGTVSKTFTNVTGFPGTKSVVGDLIVDVDQNGKPVWLWNSFDHLDVNRHPYLFPDWTHSNALLYSTDDHDLLVSVRHQNWILKIDYQDGQGSGKILWRLGEGGDFKLIGGSDPVDWFYAQHGISYFSPNTSGVFDLGVMDNGDDRMYPGGVVCGVDGGPACYSAASVYQVNESAMTATRITHYELPPSNNYSFFGGNVQDLANGDMQADFCAVLGGSLVQEINLNGSTPQIVWQATTERSYQYRAERLPSLYPGVQW